VPHSGGEAEFTAEAQRAQREENTLVKQEKKREKQGEKLKAKEKTWAEEKVKARTKAEERAKGKIKAKAKTRQSLHRTHELMKGEEKQEKLKEKKTGDMRGEAIQRKI
jgi:hypothetical protein